MAKRYKIGDPVYFVMAADKNGILLENKVYLTEERANEVYEFWEKFFTLDTNPNWGSDERGSVRMYEVPTNPMHIKREYERL